MSGGTVTPTLTPAQILAHLNALGTSGALFDASVFALKDPSAPTKIGKFSAAGITAGQTRTYTLPDATGTVPLLGLAQTWSATQTFAGINATSIGGTTPGTGAFTTLAANGATTLTAGTASSSTTTGTLVVTGGAGFSGAVYIGGLLNVAGVATLASAVVTGAATIGTTLGVTGTATMAAINASGDIASTSNNITLTRSTAGGTVISAKNNDTTAATSVEIDLIGTTTGGASRNAVRLVYQPALAAANAAYLLLSGKVSAILFEGASTAINQREGGPIAFGINDTEVARLSSTGLAIASSTASTTAATGALVVTGGAGVGGRLSVAGGTNGSTHITTVGNYGFLAFGGTADFTTGTGIAGGSATDGDFYFLVPSTRGHHFRVAGSDMALINATALTLSQGTASSSTTTGSLVVTGGAGISGALNVGGALNGTGNATFSTSGGGTATVKTYTNAAANALVGRYNDSNSLGGFYVDSSGEVFFGGNVDISGGNNTYSRGSVAPCRFGNPNGTGNIAFEVNVAAAGSAAATITWTRAFFVYATGSVALGPLSALATNATDGFTYMPTCAGTPSGTPTAVSGKVAWVYDTTNNKIYVYNGAWKATAALT